MGKRKAILLCAVGIGLLAALLGYRVLLVKPAVKVTIAEETVSVETILDEDIRLLCRTEQMTGILFVAVAAETSENAFARFEAGEELYLETAGEIPHDFLSEELTIYGKNRFVLRGKLCSTDEAGVYLLDVADWDAVYPVKTLFRAWPWTSGIFSFDLQR